MPSVGPELPPHLSKRKRSMDGSEDPKSPPRKVIAATAPRVVGPTLPRAVGPTLPPSKNPDELEVDDSSDDGYGSPGPSKPSAKPASPPTKRILGPAPPPATTTTTNPDELDIDDSSDDGYGPSLGPSAPKPASTAPAPPKRILGPAPPPASLSERPSYPADADDSSDDDGYGPSLPPAPGSAAEAAYKREQELLAQESLKASASASKPLPQRDEWMLVPPSDSDWSSKVDPTKLKNRKFASGKGAKAPAEKSGISAIWTETPEQKRQRLADEVLGRTDPSLNQNSSSSRNSGSGPSSRQEEETQRRIREYNEKNRGKSLLDVRRDAQEKGRLEKEEEEDDPSKRGFDREKDMALGGRMGHVKKKEMLERAADFGTRFQRGKYL